MSSEGTRVPADTAMKKVTLVGPDVNGKTSLLLATLQGQYPPKVWPLDEPDVSQNASGPFDNS